MSLARSSQPVVVDLLEVEPALSADQACCTNLFYVALRATGLTP